ncbi:MAG TPA: hypothetical protein VFX59_24880 [Polyangiales bacterium]|nr:hypothetical protein [Polyangiales bacterium]
MSRDDDLLERASRALRATPPPSDGELAQAKMRMLAAHAAATKKGGGRTLRWVLPLAAVLAAGTALAAVTSHYEELASVVNRVVGYEILARATKLAEPARATKPASKATPPEPAPVPAVAEPAVVEPTVAEPAAVEPAAVEPTPAEQPLASAPRQLAKPRKRELAPAMPAPAPVEQPVVEPAPAEPTPAAPEAIASADLAKYRAAHKAHFQDRDFALALRNWEAYLRQFPSGTFAIEARYNRAICLLRLGRSDEARRALTPFAKGEIGSGYRQSEATKLLEALE